MKQGTKKCNGCQTYTDNYSETYFEGGEKFLSTFSKEDLAVLCMPCTDATTSEDD